MKITLCGGLRFFDEMEKIKKELEKKGHEVHMPVKVEGTDYNNKTIEKGVENIQRYNLIRKHYSQIISSEAILVINLDKNGIKNYVGGNSFLEMGFAYINNKKIFVLNPLPKDLNYAEEMIAMSPIIINNNLNLIK